MSILLAITKELGDEEKLQFNPDKSAVMIFNNERLRLSRELDLQKKPIDFQDQYKYLEITLCYASDYLLLQEQKRKKEAHGAQKRSHAQYLWSFNRFEITRIEWKETGVAKLTYANAVLESRASKQ